MTKITHTKGPCSVTLEAFEELLAAAKYVEELLASDYPQLTLKKRLLVAIAKAEGRTT